MIEFIKHVINTLAAPTIFLPLVAVVFFLVLHYYRVVSKPRVACGILAAAILFDGAPLGEASFLVRFTAGGIARD